MSILPAGMLGIYSYHFRSRDKVDFYRKLYSGDPNQVKELRDHVYFEEYYKSGEYDNLMEYGNELLILFVDCHDNRKKYTDKVVMRLYEKKLKQDQEYEEYKKKQKSSSL